MRSSSIILLSICAVLFIMVLHATQAGSCPPPERVYSYHKSDYCTSDHDCKHGKVCCPNPARTRSCVVPGPNSNNDKYNNNNKYNINNKYNNDKYGNKQNARG